MLDIHSKISNVYSIFMTSCEIFLDFLVRDHSFIKSEPETMHMECWIVYRKDNIALYVIYEYGDFPWIRTTISGKDNSLDNIIRKNWPKQSINRKKGPSDPDKRIDFALEKYSKVLQEHISELTSLAEIQGHHAI